MIELSYIIDYGRPEITLDLYEAEFYDVAIIVQQLIGNLVTYSNHGSYEPRIARRWTREKPNIWTFELKEGFVCENGEEITAQSFKRSLERILLVESRKGGSPIFERLKGYKDFIKSGDSLPGIIADGNILRFEFETPVRNGLVQILSFAPYGYICSENFNPDGTWRDSTKFISSGPYRVKSITGHECVLEQRADWKGDFAPSSPKTVWFSLKVPENVGKIKNVILDSRKEAELAPSELEPYKLIPEYLSAIVFGNFSKGPLRDKNFRIQLKSAIERHRAALPRFWGLHHRSEGFYPSQHSEVNITASEPSVKKISTSALPELVIEGIEPKSLRAYSFNSWVALKKACEELGLKCRFAGNLPSMEKVTSQDFDIRFVTWSVGGGVETWTVEILFYSSVGPRFPDPSGRIRNLIDDYTNDKIDDDQMKNGFLSAIAEDAAIVPISHYGLQLFLSKSIDRSTISPALSVIRLDQLGLN